MTLLPALTFGFVLGLRHATDADHVAAVGTVVAAGRSVRSAALVGALWGIGHSISISLAGGALILLRAPMPARLALALEFAVALMLIGLGIRSLRSRGENAAVPAMRPLLIGAVHGLAGSAVLALLIVGTTSSTYAAVLYLLCFGVGTIAGMTAVTALLTLPAHWAAGPALRFGRGIRVVAGVASVMIGVLLAHRIGVRDGLFGATPHWGP